MTPRRSKTPNFDHNSYNFREMKKSISPKTPNFDYNLYNFWELKKSIIAIESGSERPNTRKAQYNILLFMCIEGKQCVLGQLNISLGCEYLTLSQKLHINILKLLHSLFSLKLYKLHV